MLPNLARLKSTPTGVDNDDNDNNNNNYNDNKKRLRADNVPSNLLADLPPDILEVVLSKVKGLSCDDVSALCRLDKAFASICESSADFWKFQCELRGWLKELRLSEYNRMTESMFSFDSVNVNEWRAFWRWGCSQVLSNETLRQAVKERMPRDTTTVYVDEVYGDMRQWDVSKVTIMAALFFDFEFFNVDIGGWDVSNVTNMIRMFAFTEFFNADIGGWDVTNVTNMLGMFYGANAFIQNLSLWNVSNRCNMGKMFIDTPMENNAAFRPVRPPYTEEVVAAREQKQRAARAKGERKRAEAAAQRAARRAS